MVYKLRIKTPDIYYRIKIGNRWESYKTLDPHFFFFGKVKNFMTDRSATENKVNALLQPIFQLHHQLTQSSRLNVQYIHYYNFCM